MATTIIDDGCGDRNDDVTTKNSRGYAEVNNEPTSKFVLTVRRRVVRWEGAEELERPGKNVGFAHQVIECKNADTVRPENRWPRGCEPS